MLNWNVTKSRITLNCANVVLAAVVFGYVGTALLGWRHDESYKDGIPKIDNKVIAPQPNGPSVTTGADAKRWARSFSKPKEPEQPDDQPSNPPVDAGPKIIAHINSRPVYEGGPLVESWEYDGCICWGPGAPLNRARLVRTKPKARLDRNRRRDRRIRKSANPRKSRNPGRGRPKRKSLQTYDRWEVEEDTLIAATYITEERFVYEDLATGKQHLLKFKQRSIYDPDGNLTESAEAEIEETADAKLPKFIVGAIAGKKEALEAYKRDHPPGATVFRNEGNQD